MGVCRAALAAAAAGFLLLLTATKAAVDLSKVQQILVSSVSADFADDSAAYTAASNWYGERLVDDAGGHGFKAPYIGCAEYGEGRHALASLENTFGKSAIHRVSNSKAGGSCFIMTASPAVAAPMLAAPETFGLLDAGTFLPSMKLATGLLDHGQNPSIHSGRLQSTYGKSMTPDNKIRGLSVRLSPGTLPVADPSRAVDFISDWHAYLMSDNVGMQATNFWSDPDADRSSQDKTRVREWSRAAAVVEGLASKHRRPVGEICNLGEIRMRHVGDDLLLVEGKGSRILI